MHEHRLRPCGKYLIECCIIYKMMSKEGDLVKVNFRLSVEDYNRALELVKRGEYSSMSELVRHAVTLLINEYKNSQRP